MNHPLINPEEGIRLSGGNAALYQRMLSRFACDPTLQRLEAAVSRQDKQEAYLQAHTLKGLCAQLALPALESEAAGLCLLLREEENMLAATPQTMLTAYLSTLDAIRRFTQRS